MKLCQCAYKCHAVEVRRQHMGGQLLLWYGSQELRGLWFGGEVLFALFLQVSGTTNWTHLFFFFFFLKQALCWTLSSLILTLTDGVSCRHPCPCPCCHPTYTAPCWGYRCSPLFLGFTWLWGSQVQGLIPSSLSPAEPTLIFFMSALSRP